MVELVMATAIVALIGLSIAGVAMGLSTAYAHSQDYYQCLQVARVGMLRMQSELRKASLVTAADANALALWQDTNGDGKINLDELLVLEHDAEAAMIRQHRIVWSGAMSADDIADLNIQVAISSVTGVSAVRQLLGSSQYYQQRDMVPNTTALTISVSPAPPLTKLVSIEISVREAGKTFELRSAGTLRADKASGVSQDDGSYVLN